MMYTNKLLITKQYSNLYDKKKIYTVQFNDS